MNTSVTLWQRIRRTPYQAISALFMIFITIFVMAVFLELALMSSSILAYFETKPQLTVFFKDEKDKASIDILTEKLKATGKVAGINYISKEQALSIYKEQNKNDPLLLEMVTADILPSSLEISATTPKYLADLADVAGKEEGIDEVVLQKDVVDTLISWTSIVRKVGLAFILVLLVSTLIILLNNIGMKIAFRKEEIEILRLVGATPWYIKKPFIQEGIAYGLVGSNLAWLVTSILIFYISPFVTAFLKGIPSLPLVIFSSLPVKIWPPNIIYILLLWFVLSLVGGLIGIIGSWLATSRFMK